MKNRNANDDTTMALIIAYITLLIIFALGYGVHAAEDYVSYNAGPIVITKPGGSTTICTPIGGGSSGTLVCS